MYNKSVHTHNLISVEDYNLLLGAKPPTPILEPILFENRDVILNTIMSENIEYRYINGSCEDRAHYIALLLNDLGYDCGKIWNFAPARYSLYSTELFEIKDPFGLTELVTWGYHVAPYINVYTKNGEVESVIIDQSFRQDSFLNFEEWLEEMKCPRSIYLLTDRDSYLFNSYFNYVDNNNLVGYEGFSQGVSEQPSIITGNFWYLFPNDDFVQKGMAINDLALEIFSIQKTKKETEKKYLLHLLKDIDSIIYMTQAPRDIKLETPTYEHLMKYYESRYKHWKNRLSRFKESPFFNPS